MAPKPAEVVRFIARRTRQVVITVIGFTFVLAGLAMIVLPGPAIVVIPIGFAILGTEYAWAAAALERTKTTAARASEMARAAAHRRPAAVRWT